MFKRLLPFAVLVPMLGISGCLVSDEESVEPDPRPTEGFRAQYVPLGQVLPFGNDLMFAGSEDGTLNIAAANPDNTGNPLTAMNRIDGFSTTAQGYVLTTDAVDEESFQYWTPLDPGNLIMVNVTDPESPEILEPGVDYEVVVSEAQGDAGMRIFFRPLRPLDSDPVDGDGNPIVDENGMPVPSRYMALVGTSIQSSTGHDLMPDTQFRVVRDAALANEELDHPQLEQVRQAIKPLLDAATAQLPMGLGYNGEDIAAIWSFQTVSTANTLQAIAEMVEPQEAAIQNSGMTTADAFPGQSPGYAAIWAGFTGTPYFHDKDNPLSGFWTATNGGSLTRFNPVPALRDELSIPMVVTVPSDDAQASGACAAGAEPAEGWPVVIFQHGITGNRSQMLALADALSCQGYAMVSIDQPLHGITDSTSPFFVGPESPLYAMGVGERHFYMVGGEPSDPAEVLEAEGEFDGSGEHFINLASLLTSRDNLRQATSDLLHLSATVGSIATLDQQGEPTGMLGIDTDRKFFVGHSLGGIVGSGFVALDDSIVAAVLGMPGGKISSLLLDSNSFGDPIRAGLQEQNAALVEGNPLFDNFFLQAQAIIDSGDPANYGRWAQDRNVFMIEVDGDNVVPNNATQYLSDTFDLPQISSTAEGAAEGRGIVRYLVGNHGSLLQPGGEDADSVRAWQAIQCHTAVYISTADAGAPTIDVDGGVGPSECEASDIVE